MTLLWTILNGLLLIYDFKYTTDGKGDCLPLRKSFLKQGEVGALDLDKHFGVEELAAFSADERFWSILHGRKGDRSPKFAYHCFHGSSERGRMNGGVTVEKRFDFVEAAPERRGLHQSSGKHLPDILDILAVASLNLGQACA